LLWQSAGLSNIPNFCFENIFPKGLKIDYDDEDEDDDERSR